MRDAPTLRPLRPCPVSAVMTGCSLTGVSVVPVTRPSASVAETEKEYLLPGKRFLYVYSVSAVSISASPSLNVCAALYALCTSFVTVYVTAPSTGVHETLMVSSLFSKIDTVMFCISGSAVPSADASPFSAPGSPFSSVVPDSPPAVPSSPEVPSVPPSLPFTVMPSSAAPDPSCPSTLSPS